MIIGIFSDTHDSKTNIELTRNRFVKERVELSIFCGDLVSPFTLKYLSNWPTPIKAVFGNNEGDLWGIKRRLKKYEMSDFEYAPKSGLFWEINLGSDKIAVYHGNISKFTELLTMSGEYKLVCTGHTHAPFIKKIGNTTWINPGSVIGISEDPEISQGTAATFNTETSEGKIIKL